MSSVERYRARIPAEVWRALADRGLIRADAPVAARRDIAQR
jgi:hypothetical protein